MFEQITIKSDYSILNNKDQLSASEYWSKLEEPIKKKLMSYFGRVRRASLKRLNANRIHSKALALKQAHIVYSALGINPELFHELAYFAGKYKIVKIKAFEFVFPYEFEDDLIHFHLHINLIAGSSAKAARALYQRMYRARKALELEQSLKNQSEEANKEESNEQDRTTSNDTST